MSSFRYENLDQLSKTIDKIKSGNTPDLLIGLKENEYFEAKNSESYDLTNNEKSRIELAKDVSAFANSQGGFLVLGLNQKQVLEEQTDVVESLDLIDKSKFNSFQYQGIIKDYIYPNIKGIDFIFVESASDPGFGLFIIVIPPQPEPNKPYLLARILENNEILPGIIVGIIQRKESSNSPLTIKQLHLHIQKGKGVVEERLSSIEQKMDVLLNKKEEVGGSPSTTAERIKNIIHNLTNPSLLQ